MTVVYLILGYIFERKTRVAWLLQIYYRNINHLGIEMILLLLPSNVKFSTSDFANDLTYRLRRGAVTCTVFHYLFFDYRIPGNKNNITLIYMTSPTNLILQ